MTLLNMNLRCSQKSPGEQPGYKVLMPASCQLLSLSTESEGSLRDGSNLGICIPCPWSSSGGGAAVAELSPALRPFVLLTLSCFALSLLALCCPIDNFEWILGGNRSGSRSGLYHQLCDLGQVISPLGLLFMFPNTLNKCNTKRTGTQ